MRNPDGQNDTLDRVGVVVKIGLLAEGRMLLVLFAKAQSHYRGPPWQTSSSLPLLPSQPINMAKYRQFPQFQPPPGRSTSSGPGAHDLNCCSTPGHVSHRSEAHQVPHQLLHHDDIPQPSKVNIIFITGSHRHSRHFRQRLTFSLPLLCVFPFVSLARLISLNPIVTSLSLSSQSRPSFPSIVGIPILHPHSLSCLAYQQLNFYPE